MGYPTQAQRIGRQKGKQRRVNFPNALAEAMDFENGETVEWTIRLTTRLQMTRRSRQTRRKNRVRRGFRIGSYARPQGHRDDSALFRHGRFEAFAPDECRDGRNVSSESAGMRRTEERGRR